MPRRERLPDTRQSITHKFSVAGHEGYITVGLFHDGRPGELFITMAKEGSTIGGLMDCFGTAVSMSLQYGVPLEVYVNKFSHTRFEPMGHTKNPDIRIAKSLVDYIFRWLGITFLPGYREPASPPPKNRTLGGPPGGQASPGPPPRHRRAPEARTPTPPPPKATPPDRPQTKKHGKPQQPPSKIRSVEGRAVEIKGENKKITQPRKGSLYGRTQNKPRHYRPQWQLLPVP